MRFEQGQIIRRERAEQLVADARWLGVSDDGQVWGLGHSSPSALGRECLRHLSVACARISRQAIPLM
jgi:hypothetical protein